MAHCSFGATHRLALPTIQRVLILFLTSVVTCSAAVRVAVAVAAAATARETLQSWDEQSRVRRSAGLSLFHFFFAPQSAEARESE